MAGDLLLIRHKQQLQHLAGQTRAGEVGSGPPCAPSAPLPDCNPLSRCHPLSALEPRTRRGAVADSLAATKQAHACPVLPTQRGRRAAARQHARAPCPATACHRTRERRPLTEGFMGSYRHASSLSRAAGAANSWRCTVHNRSARRHTQHHCHWLGWLDLANGCACFGANAGTKSLSAVACAANALASGPMRAHCIRGFWRFLLWQHTSHSALLPACAGCTTTRCQTSLRKELAELQTTWAT